MSEEELKRMKDFINATLEPYKPNEYRLGYEDALRRCYYLVDNLQQENKQLKEQLENKIDLYEDTISYQLGFDKGKEELQQRIDEAIEYINKTQMPEGYKKMLLEILGDKENE